MKLLLVEDNTLIIKGLDYAIKSNGYDIDCVSSVRDAINYLDKNTIDLVILDLTLPDGNGLDLYKGYLKVKNIPTIFLTANDDEDIICTSLNMGVEDYITKPFSAKELLARVNRILLRYKKEEISVSNITFNFSKMIVYENDKIVTLSPLELKILQILFLNINKVVTRDTLLDKIWEITGNDVDDHTITVYLKRIREKLDSDIIKTIKGIGYRIDDEK